MNLEVEGTFNIRLDPESNLDRAGKIQSRKVKARAKVIGRLSRVVDHRFGRQLAASLRRLFHYADVCLMRRKRATAGLGAFKIGNHPRGLFLLGSSYLDQVWREQKQRDENEPPVAHFSIPSAFKNASSRSWRQRVDQDGRSPPGTGSLPATTISLAHLNITRFSIRILHFWPPFPATRHRIGRANRMANLAHRRWPVRSC